MTEVNESNEPNETQEVIPEEAVAAESAAAKEVETITPEQKRFSALARQERKLREKERAISAAKAEVDSFRSLASKAKENPLEVLERLGITLQDLGEHVLGKPEPTSESKIEAIQRELQEWKQAQIEQERAKQKAIEEQAILNHQNKIADFVSQNSDKYELLQKSNNVGVVWDVIEQEYARTNGRRLLTIEEAADMAEAYFEKQYGETIFQSKKAQAFFQKLQKPEDVKGGTETPRDARKVSRTLTNSLTSSTAKSSNKQPLKHDEDPTASVISKMLRFNE